MTRKILLILYYWPPAGGPGVQRWLMFVRYLREFGVEPVLYLPEDPHYPITDPHLASLVPENIRIYRCKFREPYRLASLFGKSKAKRMSSGIIHNEKAGILERMMLWIRGNIFIPDSRVGWIKPALRELPAILSAEGIDTVVTSGPPHSLHLIGLGLKKQFPLRWIADFRDPWLDIGYMDSLYLTDKSRKRHSELEEAVLQAANVIITTSAITKADFQTKTKRPIHVITNGYDCETGSGTQPEGNFTMAHIGSLLTDRNPEVLWNALHSLCSESVEFARDLRLEFTGITSEEVIQTLKELGLWSISTVRDYVPHKEAISLQQNAQILLLLEIDAPKTKGILPGKVFEYLASGRPILAIGPEGWEAADLVESTGSGFGFCTQDEEGVKHRIWTWYLQYRTGNLVLEKRDIAGYHRKNLTEKLVKEVL
jgi:glycosyltransferase involved in cell wall biosynthesis